MADLIIPDKKFWPVGFTTDFVTVFPDQPVLWAPVWWNPLTWFHVRQIDLRAAAWWHDLRYFAGWLVPYSHGVRPDRLRSLKPAPNEDRQQHWKERIDKAMREDFEAAGMHPWTASAAEDVVNKFGRWSYWWATPGELAKRGFSVVDGRK